VRSREVVFAPEARDDLLAIFEWIADAAGPEVAMRYVERLEAWCDGFDLAPSAATRGTTSGQGFALWASSVW
jgi:toxin ParE1/3/4